MEYYRFILYIIFGILPSAIWLLYYLRKDLHPEPQKMILKVFFYGALVSIPIFLVEIALSALLQQLTLSPPFIAWPMLSSILNWFLVIALTEELFKYLVVRSVVLKSKELDEPLDIMLYMVVAALGFAAVENVFYLFSPIDGLSFNTIVNTTLTISFIRFIGATFLHTLCSALLGYFLALSSLKVEKRLLLTTVGILLATLLHGLYNFSIMTLSSPVNFLIPIMIIIGLSIFMIYDFDEIKKIKGICKI